MSFNSLQRLIAENKISSIEALLPFLPTSFRSKYALVFRSRSLQESSYQNPRVIIYGNDANFILTFNGSAEQNGFNTLETMEFDEKKREFLFREIAFPGKAGEKISVSNANSERCIRCHGANPRPIWDTHPLWPGSYGERYLDPLSTREQQGIHQFLLNQAKHPRYSYLEYPEIFAKPSTFVPSTKNRYEGNLRQSPNEELSRLLSTLNGKRIVSELRDSPNFWPYRYSILAALDRECDSVTQYLPAFLKQRAASEFSDFSTLAEKKNQEQEQLKRVRAVSLQGQEPVKRDSDLLSLHGLRFLAEYGLGLSTAEWTTALESDTYDFSAPQSMEAEIEAQLLPFVSKGDPSLESLAAVRKVSSSEKYCAYLRRQSEQSLHALSADSFHALKRSSTANVGGKPVLLKRCISCHQGDEGPAIAFDQPVELAASLARGTYPRGTLLAEIEYRLSPKAGADSMPRGLNISSAERSDLEEYFRTLKKLGEEK